MQHIEYQMLFKLLNGKRCAWDKIDYENGRIY